MPKTRPWAQIRLEKSKLSQEQRDRVDAEAHAEGVRMDKATKLDQLRKVRALSQEQIAEQFGTNQGAISRLERQTDFYLSTLRRFVHALGGEVRIVVQFTDADPIELDLFGDLEPGVGKQEEAKEFQPA